MVNSIYPWRIYPPITSVGDGVTTYPSGFGSYTPPATWIDQQWSLVPSDVTAYRCFGSAPAASSPITVGARVVRRGIVTVCGV